MLPAGNYFYRSVDKEISAAVGVDKADELITTAPHTASRCSRDTVLLLTGWFVFVK